MPDELNLDSEGDVDVDRFVARIWGDMEDENFSPAQKVMVLDLLSEQILSE